MISALLNSCGADDGENARLVIDKLLTIRLDALSLLRPSHQTLQLQSYTVLSSFTTSNAARPFDRSGRQALIGQVDDIEQVRTAPPPPQKACLSVGRSLTDATSKVGPYNRNSG